MEQIDEILWLYRMTMIGCAFGLACCGVVLVRNNRVFSIRDAVYSRSRHDWERLPTYNAMMMPRYWHLWTVRQWLKWLEIKRSENIA